MSSSVPKSNITYGQIDSYDSFQQSAPVSDERNNNMVDMQYTADNNELGQTFIGRIRRKAARLWLLEWLSWSIALVAICAIVGVLVVCDGMGVPDWPYGITLSALVSLLATIMTICLVEPISSGIGQSKWIWYAQERQMADFDVLDSATRGPFGATVVLVRGKGG